MRRLLYIFVVLLSMASCYQEEEVISSTLYEVAEPNSDVELYLGLFLLNEGNMGQNKATLDHFDYQTGVYSKNIFAERNPMVAFELGDVGNDLQIYDERIYAVVNCSNIVEVMDLQRAEHIGTISIPNPRYIIFDGGYGYVSSYAGELDSDGSQMGYIAKVDLETLSVVGECKVGYQPEQMAIVGGSLYVVNSGGLRLPQYDNRLMRIELDSFEVCEEWEVAINLHHLEVDNDCQLWISSRGDYYDASSKLYLFDTKSKEVTQEFDLPVSNMTLSSGMLYILSTEWNNISGQSTPSYIIIDTEECSISDESFITDGTEGGITLPYCIAVNSETGEIFVSDAKDYITPGKLHCYSAEGILQWSTTTGDIPCCIAFSSEQLEPIY